MSLEELFKDKSDEEISAFCFNVGRLLESNIRMKTNNLESTNKDLQARILSFPGKVKMLWGDNPMAQVIMKEYHKHFDIVKIP